MPCAATTPVPRLVRLLGSFVLEVLPAALASLIGGLLFVHYQFSRPAVAPPAAAAVSPASPEMVQRVRDEHALLRQFLAAQEAVQQRQTAGDAEDARGQLAAAKAHAGAALAVAKPAPPRHRTASAATAPLVVSPAPSPGPAAVVIARAQQISGPLPVAGPAPAPALVHDEPALIADTLAVKDQVFGAALHAVKVIGGIPFWIGRRLGGDDLNAQSAGTAL
jgi:hypothetical protein